MKTTAIPHTLQIPCISTRHAPDSGALDRLKRDHRAIALYHAGAFVWVPDPLACIGERSWLRPIALWARANVFDWVCLDDDGDVVDGLEVYDWEAGDGRSLFDTSQTDKRIAELRAAIAAYSEKMDDWQANADNEEELAQLLAQRGSDALKAMFVKPAVACNETVIHGTHRTQDLIPAFLDVLEGLAPAAQCVQYCLRENSYYKSALVIGDSCSWWTSEDALYLLEDLTDELNEYAPPGFYFGSHPGDGSDFGFWANEEE